MNDMWNVIANDEKKLLIIRSDSTLNMVKVQGVLHHIYINNKGKYSSFHRLIDLSALTDIDTNFDSIRDLVKSYREINPLEDNVKIAVHIPLGVTQAILRIYCQEETLKTNRYLVSGSFDECVHFLFGEIGHSNTSESLPINLSGFQSFDRSPRSTH